MSQARQSFLYQQARRLQSQINDHREALLIAVEEKGLTRRWLVGILLIKRADEVMELAIVSLAMAKCGDDKYCKLSSIKDATVASAYLRSASVLLRFAEQLYDKAKVQLVPVPGQLMYTEQDQARLNEVWTRANKIEGNSKQLSDRISRFVDKDFIQNKGVRQYLNEATADRLLLRGVDTLIAAVKHDLQVAEADPRQSILSTDFFAGTEDARIAGLFCAEIEVELARRLLQNATTDLTRLERAL